MSEQLQKDATGNDRFIRGIRLGFCLAPIIGACFYNQGLRITAGPCFFQRLFGFPGPGCGLTRSFMALAQGDWREAIYYHLFGPVLFIACILGTLQMTSELVVGRSLPSPRLSHSLCGLGVGLAGFLGYYALRLYIRCSGDALSVPVADPIWQLLVAGAKAL